MNTSAFIVVTLGYLVGILILATYSQATHNAKSSSNYSVSEEELNASVGGAYSCGFVDGQHAAMDTLGIGHGPGVPNCEKIRQAARDVGFKHVPTSVEEKKESK